ncbi:hypothetical protein D3C81_1310890 [compost metagenome]
MSVTKPIFALDFVEAVFSPLLASVFPLSVEAPELLAGLLFPQPAKIIVKASSITRDNFIVFFIDDFSPLLFVRPAWTFTKKLYIIYDNKIHTINDLRSNNFRILM